MIGPSVVMACSITVHQAQGVTVLDVRNKQFGDRVLSRLGDGKVTGTWCSVRIDRLCGTGQNRQGQRQIAQS